MCKNKDHMFHFHNVRSVLYPATPPLIHYLQTSLTHVPRTMNGQTNTRVITRTEIKATLRPAAQEDYFSCRPTRNFHIRPALRRSYIPAPLRFSNTGCSPLAAGPAGWKYTPLSARASAFESFRDDHGVRFMRRVSIRDVLLNCRWDLLWDEDALPSRAKTRCHKYLKANYKALKGSLTKCGRCCGGSWVGFGVK
jgi:hypothetical protein